MSKPHVLHPAAKADLRTAYDWYEEQQPGLGRQFLGEVDAVIAEIEGNAARFGFAAPGVREGLLQRFPYVVFYRDFPHCIFVVAVYHTSRDSDWKTRSTGS